MYQNGNVINIKQDSPFDLLYFFTVGRQSARKVPGYLLEQRPSRLSAFPLHVHGLHGATRHLGCHRGRTEQCRGHAKNVRSHGLHGLAVGLLDLLGFHHQQDAHTDVLVQGLLVWKGHIQVLIQLL